MAARSSGLASVDSAAAEQQHPRRSARLRELEAAARSASRSCPPTSAGCAVVHALSEDAAPRTTAANSPSGSRTCATSPATGSTIAAPGQVREPPVHASGDRVRATTLEVQVQPPGAPREQLEQPRPDEARPAGDEQPAARERPQVRLGALERAVEVVRERMARRSRRAFASERQLLHPAVAQYADAPTIAMVSPQDARHLVAVARCHHEHGGGRVTRRGARGPRRAGASRA